MFIALLLLTILQMFPGFHSQSYGQYSDPRHPQNLVNSAIQENKIYYLLKRYSQNLKTRLDLIESFMKDYEESSLRGSQHVLSGGPLEFENFQKGNTIANHPFMAYRMVRRFAKTLPEILEHLDLNLEPEIRHDIYDHKGNTPWPVVKDVRYSMDGIIAVQQIHDVKISEFADGRYHEGVYKPDELSTEPNPVGLNSEQCLEMGEYAFGKGLMALAIEWMTVADRKRLQDGLTQQTWSITENLQQYTAIHDDLWDLNSMSANKARGRPIYRNADLFENKLKSRAELIKRDTVDFKLYHGELTRANVWVNFKALCRGENYQHERWVKPLLFCYYERKKHPYFAISPVKIEILNKKPSVIQIYNFVNDVDVVTFQDQRQWLKGNEVLKLVEYITGLSTTDTKFELNLKRIGEFDGLKNYKTEINSPSAAFIIHLNEPLAGGEIAFPMLGFVSKPNAKSAVFWNNLLKNGNKEENLIYGRCPVLQGFLTELRLEAE